MGLFGKKQNGAEVFAAIGMALYEVQGAASGATVAGKPTEISAAIAMALHEACEWHDAESNVLTFHSAANPYSPWSSKIYTLRELPLRR
ncbi:hypothetical protein AGMMS49982_09630 [Bacteroidia bacterium]|nr:hypothetical protein AGMMS49982_09630 [Bacteroidia bacterium]